MMKKVFLLLGCLILALFCNLNLQAAIVTTNDGYKTNNGWEIYRIMLDDKYLAFCIEPGLNPGISNYTKQDFNTNYNKINATTKKQLEKIGVITNYYFQESKENLDSNYLKYYYAGQEMIWQTLGYNYTFKQDLTTYKNKIKSEVDNFAKLPSFNNQNYQIKAGESLEIKDSNLNKWQISNLSDFKSLTNLNVTKQENKIVISNPKSNTKTLKASLAFAKDNTFLKGASQVYVHDTLQNYVVLKYQDDLKAQLSVETKQGLGKIVGYKYDDQNRPLANAKFNVYQDDKVITTMTSNQDGLLQSKDLEVGNYEVKEVEAPNNYQLSSKVYSALVKVNETTYLNNKQPIINHHDKGKFKLKKLGKPLNTYGYYNEKTKNYNGLNNEDKSNYDSDLIALENVSFEVYQDNELVDTIITDKNGEAISKNLNVGTYTVKEVKTNQGYVLDDRKYQVEIKKDQVVQLNQGQDIINQSEYGGFKLLKVNENNQIIKDISFSLYKNNLLVAKYKTNDKGLIEIDNLKLGNYVLKEDVNENYQINPKEYLLEINQHQKIIDLKTITNYFQRFDLLVNKVDVITKAKLKGATFNLYQDNKLIQSAISNEQGQVNFTRLIKGCYEVEESIPPLNYRLNKHNKRTVCLNKNESLVFENEKDDYNLLIKKVDSLNKRGIAKTQFTLTNENDQKSKII